MTTAHDGGLIRPEVETQSLESRETASITEEFFSRDAKPIGSSATSTSDNLEFDNVIASAVANEGHIDLDSSPNPFQKFYDARAALSDDRGGDQSVEERLRAMLPMAVANAPLLKATAQWNRILPELKIDRQNGIEPPRPPEEGSEREPTSDKNIEKVQSLFDSNASADTKLRTIQQLVGDGVNRVTLRNENGEPYSLRLEVIPVRGSNRNMVHMFITGANGRERVVLRGIDRGDGTFEQQRNPRGNFVSYHGTGENMFYSIKPQDISLTRDVRPDGRDRRPDIPVTPGRTPQQIHAMFDRAAREAGGAGRLARTSQGIYLRSNFDVDVDGSPRARQIDPYGQTQTSWSYERTRGHKYINAEEVPYIVLPRGQYQKYGIKLGDYALVRDKATGRVAVAVFADVGPGGKTGEGSIYLGRQGLGLDVTPNIGVSENRFEYLVFPGTSEGRAQSQQQLLARIEQFKQRVGLTRPDAPDRRSIDPRDGSDRGILSAAMDSVGRAMWAITQFRNSVRGGRWGCAAAVSAVLQLAGIDYANHAGVAGLVSQLQSQGWQQASLSQAEPGDVVVKIRRRNWRQGGGGSHIGIVGEGGDAYHNSSGKRTWQKGTLNGTFGGGIANFVLKPPSRSRYA